jgi:hypothetical protein
LSKKAVKMGSKTEFAADSLAEMEGEGREVEGRGRRLKLVQMF